MTFKNLLIGLVGIGLIFLLTGCEGMIIIPPINQPPVAVISSDPTAGYAKISVSFDASNSYDPDGAIVSYYWYFGDGTTGSGTKVTHLYEDDSDLANDGYNEGYIVTLTVVDDKGASRSTSCISNSPTCTLIVHNPPPIADFSWQPRNPYTFDVVTFDASKSYDPAVYKALGIVIEPAKIVSYHWDFGDGTTGEGIKVSHSYANDGRYLVTLTVTDDDYALGSSSQVIEVLNRSPVADFTWRDCYPPGGIPLESQPEGIIFTRCIEFDASGSKDPDGWIVSYYWDFGDGTTGRGVVTSHEFIVDPNVISTYTITLTITDNDGATVQKKVKIRL